MLFQNEGLQVETIRVKSHFRLSQRLHAAHGFEKLLLGSFPSTNCLEVVPRLKSCHPMTLILIRHLGSIVHMGGIATELTCSIAIGAHAHSVSELCM